MNGPDDTVLLTPTLTASSACFQCRTPLLARRCGHCGAAAVAGRWRTLRVLSQKSWSRVYHAQNEAGTQAALKELLFSEAPGAAAVEAFTREAELLKEISHPNVPRLIESFQEGSGAGTRLYTAQELVAGRSLASLMETSTFTEKEAERVAQHVLKTLSWLHGRSPRILHRDIKPSNLILRQDGTVALVDFGTARGVVDMTLSSTFGGTFGYAPIEQLGGTADATTDLYALGATLVHLLTGTPPDKLLGKDFGIELGQLNVSPRFRGFLGGLLARNPRDRIPSADAALQALRQKTGDGASIVRVSEAGLLRAKRTGQVLTGAFIVVGALAMLLAGHFLWR